MTASASAAARLTRQFEWEIESARRESRRQAARVVEQLEPGAQETARGYRARLLRALKTGVSNT